MGNQNSTGAAITKELKDAKKTGILKLSDRALENAETENLFHKHIRKLAMLHEVHLNNNRLTEITDTILRPLQQQQIQLLFLNNNLLVEPFSLSGHFGQLQELNLSDNKLQTLPNDFFLGCQQLNALYINNNKLTSLPTTISQCSSLKV